VPERRSSLAAQRTLVDLQAAASGCRVPYTTLARWAKQRGWTVHAHNGLRKLYDYETVMSAVHESKQQAA
jgi:hypothetical protein